MKSETQVSAQPTTTVAVYGDVGGRAVLWWHGGLSSRLDAALLDQAGKAVGAAIVAFDRPGIGASPGRSKMTVSQCAATALAQMSKLGHQRFAVAGWSAGGPYALACAAAAPERVKRVATIASMHPLTDDRYRRELGLRLDRLLLRWAPRHPACSRALVRAAAAMPEWLMVRDILGSTVEAERGPVGRRRQLLVEFVRESTRKGCCGVVDDYARLAHEWGFDLGSVVCEVTVWHGNADPMVPLSHGSDLANALPRSRFEVLADRGHFLPFTDAERIIADLVSATTSR